MPIWKNYKSRKNKEKCSDNTYEYKTVPDPFDLECVRENTYEVTYKTVDPNEKYEWLKLSTNRFDLQYVNGHEEIVIIFNCFTKTMGELEKFCKTVGRRVNVAFYHPDFAQVIYSHEFYVELKSFEYTFDSSSTDRIAIRTRFIIKNAKS